MTLIVKADELEAAGHDVVRLSIEEPDFGASPVVHAAMCDVWSAVRWDMPLP